jgi:hypothetical protein
VPFAAQLVKLIWSEGARQGAGESIDRILLTDQDQLTWSACLGPEAIAHFEPSPNEGVLGDRDLILGAHFGIASAANGLYSCTHE